MDIAFYAPMKSPNSPVPSGDREMARLLMRALRHTGHTVRIVSELRSYCSEANASHYAAKSAEGAAEIAQLEAQWRSRKPDVWLTYHPYYKSPDLLGPKLCKTLNIPYLTCEASYSARRNIGAWVQMQALVADGMMQAAMNICLTRRDRDGLVEAIPEARVAMLPPFIDVEGFEAGVKREHERTAPSLIAVGMMRPGDKLESFRILASALERLADRSWSLTLVGNGPARPQVEQAFGRVAAGRIMWAGELARPQVAAALSEADIYVWPGRGEAYGLAYLEAQACGLPVVAMDTAGVAEVIMADVTGILTPEGNVDAYAAAVGMLMDDAPRRKQMGQAAARFVHSERSFPVAAQRLDSLLREAVG